MLPCLQQAPWLPSLVQTVGEWGRGGEGEGERGGEGERKRGRGGGERGGERGRGRGRGGEREREGERGEREGDWEIGRMGEGERVIRDICLSASGWYHPPSVLQCSFFLHRSLSSASPAIPHSAACGSPTAPLTPMRVCEGVKV